MKVIPTFKSNLFLLTMVLISCILCVPKLSAQSAYINFTSPTYIGGYHIKCNGQSTGSVLANPSFGTGPYTYLWNNGETTAQISNKPAGIYIVTVTDANSVSHNDTIELKQPNSLNYQSTLSNYHGYNIEKHGYNNGSIQLAGTGGTPPYNYLWSNNNTNATRSGLTAGNYSFTITDANQCSSNGNISLTEPNPVQFSFTNVQNTQCSDGADGAATINISGGLGEFSVVWSNGSFSFSPNDLPAGYNEVRILEHGRAIIDTGITINSPAHLEIDLTLSQYANGYNVSCVDCYNGSITTTVTGGTAPYTYLWDDESNSTTANLGSLNGGKYNVSIVDAHGCENGTGAILRMPIAKDWSRTGNASIDPAEFIGSTDASDVVFKTNNQEALRLAGNGNVGVGTDSPTEKLEVEGNLKVKGSIKLGEFGKVDYYDNNNGLKGMRYIPDVTFYPSGTLQPSLPSCPPYNGQGFHFFDGFIASRSANLTEKPITFIGNNQEGGYIESTSENSNNTAPLKLKLNYYCGNDVTVGNNTTGNLIALNKIGIGIENPNEKLEVDGNGLFSGKLGIGLTTPNEKLEVNGNAIINGRLSIGGHDVNNNYFSTNTDYQLCVNGKIVATEVLVKLRQDWPDYVFKKDYKMKSIKEVKSFIKSHGHLPGIPSAKEINENGINTGEMLNLQMQKIEELTLYIIDLQKQIDALKQAKN